MFAPPAILGLKPLLGLIEQPEEIARWAREHELPYDDGHVHLPRSDSNDAAASARPLDDRASQRPRMEVIAAFGFTERQSCFLLNVLLHSGDFVERQYCAFAGIATTINDWKRCRQSLNGWKEARRSIRRPKPRTTCPP